MWILGLKGLTSFPGSWSFLITILSRFFFLPLLLLLSFFLFVRSALNFALLSTTYLKSIASSQLSFGQRGFLLSLTAT